MRVSDNFARLPKFLEIPFNYFLCLFFAATYSWMQDTLSVGESDRSVEICLQRIGVPTPKTVGKLSLSAPRTSIYFFICSCT